MQVLDASGTEQSSTLVYGFGIGPQATYSPVRSTLGLVTWPEEIAVDGGGNVFATAQGMTHVQEYPASGGAPTSLGAGLTGAFGVAVDGLGNVYASDEINNRIVTIAPNGAQNVLSSKVTTPLGVAVDNVGNVYVADYGNNRVVKISAIGGVQTTITGGAWQNPLGVAVDGAGNFYTTDGYPTPARQVRKFNVSTVFRPLSARASLLPAAWRWMRPVMSTSPTPTSPASPRSPPTAAPKYCLEAAS